MIKQSIVIFCVLALGGCTTNTRPCPGFGTPLADKWSTALEVGDVVTYVSDAGVPVQLELREREDSEPYVGSSRNGSSEVICGSESVRQYEFVNNDVALRFKLAQTHAEDPAQAAGESFTITIRPQSPAGETLAFGYLFFLGEAARQQYSDTFVLDNDTETGPSASRSIENLLIGSNEYQTAVEEKYADTAPVINAVADPNSLSAITRMIVAEDGGLVQFELLNGEIYSRI